MRGLYWNAENIAKPPVKATESVKLIANTRLQSGGPFKRPVHRLTDLT
jgi:hypothetical protein